ncbi:hypothetical protein [Rathayibacter festucae]|nr:hypothetical protein [Rathayibacter festucae]
MDTPTALVVLYAAARGLASKGQRVEVIDQTAFLDLLRSVGAVL